MGRLLYLIITKSKDAFFMRVIVFILIGYTVFTLNFTVSRWYYDTNIARGLSSLKIDETMLYVEPRELIPFEQLIYDYCREKVEKLDGVRGLTRNTLFEENSNGTIGKAYNRLIAPTLYVNAIDMPMNAGQWFSDISDDFLPDGILPCVISYDLKAVYAIGDIIEDKDGLIQVVGVAKKNTYIPTNQSGGVEVNLNNILRKNERFFIIQNDSDPYLADVCFSVVLESGANVEDVAAQCRNELRNVANVYTYTELLERSAEYNGEIIRMQGLIFAVMALISLIGAGSCNLLLTLSDRRIFAIYYVNGFSWESGLLLTALQNIVFLLLPILMGLSAYYVMLLFMHSGNITSSIWNWIMSGGFLILLFILTSILPIMTLRKNSPLSIIRKL